MDTVYIKNAQRVRDFAISHFRESGMVRWPTVREVTRRLKLTQAQIVEFTDEGINSLMKTQYQGDTVVGDHFIEVNEVIEA